MTPAERRKQENAQLLERMKDPNDNLAAYDVKAKWYQPRPVIQKNQTAIERLYGKTK